MLDLANLAKQSEWKWPFSVDGRSPARQAAISLSCCEQVSLRATEAVARQRCCRRDTEKAANPRGRHCPIRGRRHDAPKSSRARSSKMPPWHLTGCRTAAKKMASTGGAGTCGGTDRQEASLHAGRCPVCSKWRLWQAPTRPKNDKCSSGSRFATPDGPGTFPPWWPGCRLLSRRPNVAIV